MLVVNLIGGLGNQMFQYALGLSLGATRGTEVKFDITELLDRTPKENFTYRDFELGIFKGEVSLASKKELLLYKYQPVNIIERVAFGVLRRLKRVQAFYEKGLFRYDESVWQTSSNTYFTGYWQLQDYFMKHEKLIRRELAFRDEPKDLNAHLASKIKEQNAVSVHIRRGDYVSNATVNQVHGTCSPEYYRKAVALIASKIENPTLYIFSDDPVWVRQNMVFDMECVYVNHNGGRTSFEDMRLMSMCKHNVIANSSFSWWGAWLNNNPSKIVVAPRQWMLSEDVSNASESFSPVPKDWIKI